MDATGDTDATRIRIAAESSGSSSTAIEVPIETRIEEARQKRDALLQQRELHRIEEEIALLERGSVVDPVDETQTDTGTSSSVQRERRRRHSSEEQDGPPRKRSARLRDPTVYSGYNLKQYRNFVRDCELAAKNAPAYFPEEDNLVTWAMQYLEGDPKESWWAQYELMKAAGEPITWASFTQHLLDSQVDPINRGLDAAIMYQKAVQRKDQTTRAFATYLQTLEDELPKQSEEQRVTSLFGKLREELQVVISNQMNVPATREALIIVATTQEKNLRKTTKVVAPPTRPLRTSDLGPSQHSDRGKTDSRRGRGTHSSRRRSEGRPRSDQIRCYTCDKEGHISPNCPEKNANKAPLNQVRASGKDVAFHRSRGR